MIVNVANSKYEQHHILLFLFHTKNPQAYGVEIVNIGTMAVIPVGVSMKNGGAMVPLKH